MAITIDKEACVGCGLCVNNCPDCFEMADDGIAIVKDGNCTSCNPSEIAEQCPVDAIKVD